MSTSQTSIVQLPAQPARPNGWSQLLARPLRLRNGATLETLADGHAFIHDLSPDHQSRQSWQEALRLMVEACESGQVAAATDKLDRALFLNYFLELKS